VRLLVDTCTLLFWAAEPEKLSGTARVALRNPDHEPLFSAVSAWEIAVKQSIGKLALDRPASIWVRTARERLGVASLPLEEEAALAIARLPALHRDPFDRMLVAQALVHGLTIVTPDPAIQAYPTRTLW
jgi:PIN domain nuclease of toxin-antitoxin system